MEASGGVLDLGNPNVELVLEYKTICSKCGSTYIHAFDNVEIEGITRGTFRMPTCDVCKIPLSILGVPIGQYPSWQYALKFGNLLRGRNGRPLDRN